MPIDIIFRNSVLYTRIVTKIPKTDETTGKSKFSENVCSAAERTKSDTRQ
jgi:hypothetical protein